MIEAVRFAEPVAFRERVQPFLERDAPRHNLMLGILGTLTERPDVYDRKLLCSLERDGEVVAALLTTPPFHPVVSDFDVRSPRRVEITDAIVGTLCEEFGHVDGVTANVPCAAVVTEAWQQRTGDRAAVHTALGVFKASRVVPPAPVAGHARPATPDDSRIVFDWHNAFAIEAHQRTPNEVMRRNLEARLRREGGGVDLWEVDGAPVSLTGFGTYAGWPDGARVGPVYTPPSQRRCGYASALVAATTRRLLHEGRAFCFLNTDLANPTSNHIYQALGYERVCTAEEWRFERAIAD